MPLLTRRAIVLAKKETTYGVDASPAAASDAFEVIADLVPTPVGTLLERDPFRASLSPARPLLGQRWYEFGFVVEVRGSGTNSTPPRGIGALLQACGLVETVTAGVKVEYKPASANLSSCTIYLYLDGSFKKFLGCRGSVRILSVGGETAKFFFRFLGKYTEPTDVAMVSPTYDATIPPVVLGANFTFDGATTFVVQQLEIDLANIISPRADVNDTTGIKGFEIVGREGRGSFNPEAVLVGTKNFWSLWTNSTPVQLSIVIGSAAGNKYTITCPKIVIETIGYGDRTGVRTFEMPFRLSYNTGDDEITIEHS